MHKPNVENLTNYHFLYLLRALFFYEGLNSLNKNCHAYASSAYSKYEVAKCLISEQSKTPHL